MYKVGDKFIILQVIQDGLDDKLIGQIHTIKGLEHQKGWNMPPKSAGKTVWFSPWGEEMSGACYIQIKYIRPLTKLDEVLS